MKKDGKKIINEMGEKEEKNFEKILIDTINDDFDIDQLYTINSTPTYNLKECLEKISPVTFCYYDLTYQLLVRKKNKIKKQDKLVKYYYNLIIKTIEKNKEDFSLTVINHAKNPKKNEKDELLLSLGMEFIFEENGKKQYIIPTEVMDKFNEVFDEETMNTLKKNDLKELIYTYISINGFIPEKILKEYIAAEEINEEELNEIIKQMHGHHYKEFITLFNKEQINILTKEHKLEKILEEKKKIDYFKLDEDAIQEYKNMTQSLLIDYDEGVLALLLAMQQSPIDLDNPIDIEEQLETLKSKIDPNQRDLVDKLYENYGTIRYWYLNGRTINEYLLEKNEDYYLKKPKKTDLKSLLKLYDKKILKEVMDWYEVETIEQLKEVIIEEESLSNYQEMIKMDITTYNNENIKNIINKINFDDIFDGLIYIYKEGTELKYVIPNELLERIEDSFTNNSTLLENVEWLNEIISNEEK